MVLVLLIERIDIVPIYMQQQQQQQNTLLYPKNYINSLSRKEKNNI